MALLSSEHVLDMSLLNSLPYYILENNARQQVSAPHSQTMLYYCKVWSSSCICVENPQEFKKSNNISFLDIDIIIIQISDNLKIFSWEKQQNFQVYFNTWFFLEFNKNVEP